MYFFSRKTMGFYHSSIHGQMPDDVVELSGRQYADLLEGQRTGRRITFGSDGVPVLEPQPDEHKQAKTIHSLKTVSVNQACEAAITAGFTSEALGAPHFYSSQLDDQLNLTGAVLRGLDMPYACRDERGVKEFRLHTAEQLRQVGDDFTLYKLQLLQHANELKKQLNAALDAGDLAALEAISWEAPQP